jgi:serine protease Do
LHAVSDDEDANHRAALIYGGNESKRMKDNTTFRNLIRRPLAWLGRPADRHGNRTYIAVGLIAVAGLIPLSLVMAAPATGQDLREIQAGDVSSSLQAPSRTIAFKPALALDHSAAEVFSQLKKVVNWTAPCVVHIEAKKITPAEDRLLTGGRDSSRTVETDEAGAGIVFEHRQRYFVLTNRHVILGARADNIFIQMHDGTFFYPYRVWEDPKTDLAVLGLEAANLRPADVGDSDSIGVGDFVVAIGSPFGLNHSVSYGIISATGRRNLDLGRSGVMYQDFFQTDAAINPGNSGGPLINLTGQVVAINTAIASNSGGNDGIGFAIPIRMAMKVATDLIDYGRVRRAYLGVTLDSHYSAKTAASLGLNTVFGARVLRVGPETPASQAGVQIGDVVLEFNQQQVRDDSHLVLMVSQAPTDQPLSLTVFRNGQRYALSIRLVENPGE